MWPSWPNLPIFLLGRDFVPNFGCAVALEKATLDLTLQHLVRLAGSAPGINIPVYFAVDNTALHACIHVYYICDITAKYCICTVHT